MENIIVWEPVQLYCPNCGKKIMGYQNNKGVTKMQCDRCRYMVVTVKKSPVEYDIKIRRPSKSKT